MALRTKTVKDSGYVVVTTYTLHRNGKGCKTKDGLGDVSENLVMCPGIVATAIPSLIRKDVSFQYYMFYLWMDVHAVQFHFYSIDLEFGRT